MKTKSRIASILKANSLNASITGLPTFELSELNLANKQEFDLPTNIRLGHLAEKVVAGLIRSSSNYDLLYENVQVIEEKQTIGEIDFIVEENTAKELIHMELAYKFYLYDPSISPVPLNNWIGPNRNDSLQEKLEKLKTKQFPLLYHEASKSRLNVIAIDEIGQKLCLLVSLYIPYEYKGNFKPAYEKAVKGYYINLKQVIALDDVDKAYHLPPKKEWGIDPAENEIWADFKAIEKQLKTIIKEKQAPLCWQKHEGSYLEFFIVWW